MKSYFTTGKGMDDDVKEIELKLKRVPRKLARRYGLPRWTPATLLMVMDGANELMPTCTLTVRGHAPVDLKMPSAEGTTEEPQFPQKAYERLIVAAMRDDNSAFPAVSEPIAGWRVVEPVLRAKEDGRLVPEIYPSRKPRAQGRAGLLKSRRYRRPEAARAPLVGCRRLSRADTA